MTLLRSPITHLRCYHVFACTDCDYRVESDVGEPTPSRCEWCGVHPLEKLEPLLRMSYVRVTVTRVPSPPLP